MNSKLLPAWMNKDAKAQNQAPTLKAETERALRDIAFVLKMTRRVRHEMMHNRIGDSTVTA